MMKHIFARIFCLVIVCAFTMVAPNGAHAVNSTGPYYALPSWDQKLPAATRFVVLTDWNSEAVLDRNTGLVWEKSPSTTPQSAILARVNCLRKNIGTQKGFRLPSIVELSSLVDVSNSDPALPTGHPFLNVQAASYWSATLSAESPSDFRWEMDFFVGTPGTSSKTNEHHFWCVRGPMNADQY